MRLRHPDGTLVHVAYCTNVHPAEDLDGVVEQLRRYAAPVRATLGLPRLGLGLWLPAPLAHRLARDPGETARLRAALTGSGLEVVTLNAFPYSGFHDPVVKGRVYRPDWTEPERLAYTLDCARVLTELLPDEARRGSVSTLPLAWREPWGPRHARLAAANLERLASGLRALAAETGRPVRVGLEPEPGCRVETTGDAARLLAGTDHAHIGVCLDTCHLAVAFEEPERALSRLSAAGLPVVKVQASAAIQAGAPDSPAARSALASFAEDRFLHQVRGSTAEGVRACDDLPEALGDGSVLDGAEPWRVHFHVPLHREPIAPLESTRRHLEQTLSALFGGGTAVTDHLEVETYTWSVLPERQRPRDARGLVDGLAGELAWVRDRLVGLGLKEET
ncbi:metabolite traffic protein EboE [Marinactinospora thermotolerans]|uniref:Xylose isomerase-like TIM barrel n=1 Tax=Marinactinospora thermotolerans DSM 45154 TaxID=1122192 RepID=A0A1T4SNY1_9ACTN|nr:metabolite traffic protein EboE [Marinactinospora thermotolerans]SKA29883.1 Xylose isomerase-like TIM barrel [Marinactinospora thermotolerans DSM 45154]